MSHIRLARISLLLSTTLTAGALLAVCRWWFNREQVLFRN